MKVHRLQTQIIKLRFGAVPSSCPYNKKRRPLLPSFSVAFMYCSKNYVKVGSQLNRGKQILGLVSWINSSLVIEKHLKSEMILIRHPAAIELD